jgi:hypothetical protein
MVDALKEELSKIQVWKTQIEKYMPVSELIIGKGFKSLDD